MTGSAPGAVKIPTGVGREARSPRPARLAIFTSHPIQYQAPLFRALARRADVEPRVYFASTTGLDGRLDPSFGTPLTWDVPLLDGYESVFLENVARRHDVSRFTGLRVRGLADAWREARVDAALVFGWGTLAHLQAWAAAFQLGIPLLVRGEANLAFRSGTSARARARKALWVPVRDRVYGRLFARAAGFLSIGTRNSQFYRHLGVPEDKLWWAPYGVDNAAFALPEPRRSAERARIREQLGVSDATVVFASAAKLIARKRPYDLLRAVAKVAPTEDVHLLFIGSGPEEQSVRAEAERLGIPLRVTVSGFVNQSQLPAWYAAADCLVLPSDHMETWGLVVNEAMAARLPVVVSDAAGCSPDLVRPGENGFTFPFSDVDALANRLRQIVAAGAGGRARMGEASGRLVENFSIDVVADAIGDALRSALGSGRSGAPGSR